MTDDAWLNSDAAASFLGYTVRQFRERVACRPGFPKAVRPAGGHPRWLRSELHEWMLAEREKTGGRPREAA